MLLASTFLAVAAALLWRGLRNRKRPLDRDELLIIGRVAEQVRKEEFHPYG
ncbi:MAG TPA: hypothetical protein VLW65_17315 [Bryobacteraceae bacterium]|nr:hypothetical protein [Bryobacteraceae bacterium]